MAALAAYQNAASGIQDYNGLRAAQIAGWQHSMDNALGNSGDVSPQGALMHLLGNSVSSAMSSALKQRPEHTLVTAQTTQTVLQTLPELSTNMTLALERVFEALSPVVSFNRMGFGFKKIEYQLLETRLAQWVPGADLTGGVVASYTGRSTSFGISRFAAAAQIEATALFNDAAVMIFEALLAGLVESLRLTWAKLALVCMLNNGGRPTIRPSSEVVGRPYEDVLSFYNRVACAGSRSSSALTMLGTILAEEGASRGGQEWPYLLVSSVFVRRAAALLTPGPNLITGKPSGRPIADDAAVSAVSAVLGKTLIVIPEIPDGRRSVQLLLRRVNCIESIRVPANYLIEPKLNQIQFTGANQAEKDAKRRALRVALKKSLVVTHADRPRGHRQAFRFEHLMSNATMGVNADTNGAVAAAASNISARFNEAIDNFDMVLMSPHTVCGDIMIACAPNAVELYSTQVLSDAAVAVESRLLTIEQLCFMGTTLPEIRKVLVLPPLFAKYRLVGGRAQIIPSQTMVTAKNNFAAKVFNGQTGFAAIIVPRLTSNHMDVDDNFGTIHGRLDSSMTGIEQSLYLYGDNATANTIEATWNLDNNYISLKRPTENHSTKFSIYTCAGDSIMYLPPFQPDQMTGLTATYVDAAAAQFTAAEIAAIRASFKEQQVLRYSACKSFNGGAIYPGSEEHFLAKGDKPCQQEGFFTFQNNPGPVLSAIVPPV